MNLTKETAYLIDELLKASIEKHEKTKDPNFQLKEFQKTKADGTPYSFDELQDTMIIAQRAAEKHKLINSFSFNGIDNFSMTLENLRPFLRSGGFASIWQEEEKERQLKTQLGAVNQSVIDTNDNVRKTNNKTWIIASLAAIFSLLTLIKDISQPQGLTDKTITPLLQQQTQSLNNIQQNQKDLNQRIDSLTKAVYKKK